MSIKQLILSSVERVNFILAGNATFTLRSKKTGEEFLYLVQTPKKYPDSTKRYVYVYMEKMNPTTDPGRVGFGKWFYIGMLHTHGKMKPFAYGTRKGELPSNHIAVHAFAWLWYKLIRNENHERAEVLHIGKCGRCKRKLLDPASLKRGLGPICYAIIRRKHYGKQN